MYDSPGPNNTNDVKGDDESSAQSEPKEDESKPKFERLTRTRFFLGVCELLRQRSCDPFFKFGCCLVKSDTREVGPPYY